MHTQSRHFLLFFPRFILCISPLFLLCFLFLLKSWKSLSSTLLYYPFMPKTCTTHAPLVVERKSAPDPPPLRRRSPFAAPYFERSRTRTGRIFALIFCIFFVKSIFLYEKSSYIYQYYFFFVYRGFISEFFDRSENPTVGFCLFGEQSWGLIWGPCLRCS